MPVEQSVAERIVQQIKRKLEAMNATDNNGIKFTFTKLNPLDHTKKFSGNACSVLDLGITYGYQTTYLQTFLQIGVEVWMQLKEKEEGSVRYRQVRAELHKVLAGTDTNLVEAVTGDQLAENIQVVSDDPDIGDDADRLISGMFQFTVTFRTKKNDPYVLM